MKTVMGKGTENRAGFAGIIVKVDVDADLSKRRSSSSSRRWFGAAPSRTTSSG
jgi:hypothetical protein